MVSVIILALLAMVILMAYVQVKVIIKYGDNKENKNKQDKGYGND